MAYLEASGGSRWSQILWVALKGFSDDRIAVEGDILPDTILLQSADLAFTAYTLDKEGMSSKYCPYCPLTKAQWMLPVGERPIVEPWTLPRMIAMCDDNSKKGPQKLGIKCHPKVPSIEVSGLVLPATHMGIGVDNDIMPVYRINSTRSSTYVGGNKVASNH